MPIYTISQSPPALLPDLTGELQGAGGGLRKVGVPSIVVTRGLVSPPFSKSWADIFLTGVLLPPDPVDLELVDSDLEESRLEGRIFGWDR